MRSLRQFQGCLLFLYRKISRAQNLSQANINQQNKIRQTQWQQIFARNNIKEGESRLFYVLVPFVPAKSFRKNKNKQARNCLDNLILLC